MTNSKLIRIPGSGIDDFPCPLRENWTVADLKQALYDAYQLTGGYISNGGAATRSSDIIVEDGDYVYVDFQRPQTTVSHAGTRFPFVIQRRCL
jgi:hypothetical protein